MLLDLRDHARRVLTPEGSSPAWLPDSRRFLFSTLTHVSLLDVQTGSVQELLPLPRTFDAWGRTIALSADGTTLVYLQSQAEGDVWMMTLSD